MDSSSSIPISFSRPDPDHFKWIPDMRKTMRRDVEEIVVNTDVCIFSVPKTLLDTNPDSYIPEQVALGPIHQWRQQVYGMQKYKIAAARKVEKRRNAKFEEIVEDMKLTGQDVRVQACYDMYFNMTGDDLAWMMAFDVSFLLDFLQDSYGNTGIGLSFSRALDDSQKKLSHTTILRDVVKLENQIPLFLIKMMMEHDRGFIHEPPTETLQIMLMGLYHEVSPFECRVESSVDINQCDHLLHFLYQMTVPNANELGINVPEKKSNNLEGKEGSVGEKENLGKPSDLTHLIGYIWEIIKNAKCGFVKKIFLSPITLVLSLPWRMLSRLTLVENTLANLKDKPKDDTPSKLNRPPVIEEITIPSVTKMARAGIVFKPIREPISKIHFDETTSTLYLPVVHLGVNTEVYLRNLVAYEACVASGPLVMARYTELMNGIIDTKEDAKILMDYNIVYNHLKSEKEVADLWNGMSKCVKMTKVPFMYKVVDEVNKRYDRTWRVKLGKFMAKYVFASWKFLTLLAAVLLLLLSMVQAVCSVYNCARVIKMLPKLNEPPE